MRQPHKPGRSRGMGWETHNESLSNYYLAGIRQPRHLHCHGRISSAAKRFFVAIRGPVRLLGEFARSMGRGVANFIRVQSRIGWHLLIDHRPQPG